MTSHAVTSRSGTAPAGSKLRDSCLACSSSKVRCPREKPTCSRCQRRRVTCQYLTSKRAGRKHDTSHNNVLSRSNSTSNATMQQASPPFESMTNRPQTPAGTSAPTTTVSSSPPAASTAHNLFVSPQLFDNDLFSDWLTPAGAFDTYANAVTPQNHDLDSLLSPLTSISSTLDGQGADITLGGVLGFTSDLNNTGVASGDLQHNLEYPPGLVNGVFLGLPGIDQHTHPPEMETDTNTKKQGAVDDQATLDSDCDCLVQIMRLMRQLFPRPSPSSTNLATSTATPPIHSVSAIIERNRSSMDVVSVVLSCSCLDDPHMLAVTAHVVSKLLGWYVIAVQRAISGPSEPQTVTSSDDNGSNTSTTSASDNKKDGPRRRSSSAMLSPPYSNHKQSHWETDRADNDSVRMAAQLVLGELHLAQRLVTDLVSKLKSQRSPHKCAELAGLPLGKMTEPLLLPLSPTVLDLLGNNLRDQLKTLSIGIVKRLRDD
ncbi:hypothetical protein F4801DRAFT_570150 [Xylaria longipes]|nr:hypothetical protein F4801DRAFT_570150 [Xylaria longipes]